MLYCFQNPRFDDNGDIVACDKPLRSVTSLITEMSCADTTGAHRVTSEAAAVDDGNSGATALHAVAKVPAASDRASTKADSQPQQSNFNPVNRQINVSQGLFFNTYKSSWNYRLQKLYHF